MMIVSALLLLFLGAVYSIKDYEDADRVNDTIFCEIPSLPKSAFHVVIAGYKHRETSEDYSYLFSLTNVQFFHYRRQFATVPLTAVHEMCGVVVEEKLMLPNHGREAAAFFDYAYEHYENPPEVVAFLHGHAAISWHTTCNSVYSRLLLTYRQLTNEIFPMRMYTLTGNKKQNKFERRLQLEPNDQALVDKCHTIFTSHNTSLRVAGRDHFYSCCASFIIPGKSLRMYPKSLYLSLRNYHLMSTDDNMAGRYCFEFLIYDMFSDEYVSNSTGDTDKKIDTEWYQKASNLSDVLKSQYFPRLQRCYASQQSDIVD